ncbi:uncharacterized protein BDR25DRAFT_341170 [Lindgomyces ingoldianus]|uniref:Uncharacterized protein n=1 Tax=Lindgomyces ingoldianus TaxID=673940 RepID=A0ACB6R3S7_9PLEO|nr:uncharacterized protein BDR25DRAFT_341170 [Lindgomyces ingoldianus]KAF2473943.1 hypothetical protein BDR25DRAFT_341170 [Lindgomyces ingoldianus]
MPPPLSDYESDEDWGVHTTEVTNVKLMVPKGRKRSAALAGIDPENIIPISGDNQSEVVGFKDAPLTSSIPTSSYKTRAQVNGTQRSELCYDQKYHPMDDFVQPKRAAKLRSMYGEDTFLSDIMSASSKFSDGNHTDSDARVEEHLKKGKSKKLPFPQSSQPTRHSSRQVNLDATYSMSTHPQAIEAKTHKRHSAIISGSDKDAEHSQTIETADKEKHRKDSGNLMGLTVIPHTEDQFGSETSNPPTRQQSPADTSRSTQQSFSVSRQQNSDAAAPRGSTRASFPAHLTPSKFVSPHSKLDERLSTRDRKRAKAPKGFPIYVEPVQAQLTAEASAPPPIDYPDDNYKENQMEGSSEDEDASSNEFTDEPTSNLPQPQWTEDLSEHDARRLGLLHGSDIDSVLSDRSSGVAGIAGPDYSDVEGLQLRRRSQQLDIVSIEERDWIQY